MLFRSPAYGDVGQAPATAGYPSSATPGSAGYDRGREDSDGSTIRISGVLRNPPPTGGYGTVSGSGPAGGATELGARRGRHETDTDEVHVVTGVPVTRPVTPSAPPFDVFAPRRRSEPGSGPAADGPYPQSYPDFGGRAADDSPSGNNTDSSASSLTDEPADSTEFKGLPRRVRQANLAPELRASAKAAASAQEAGVPRATAASLADMRNTLSAMQRGWQQGRSQTQPNTEGGADGN